MLYLDHAATTPLRPEAREAMEPFLGDDFGNPSGIHEVSRRAKNALEEAREHAAELVGASHPLDIVFTGGGTESDNLAVIGSTLADGGRGGVVTTAVEHEAVLAATDFAARLGCPVQIVPVGPSGVVDPQAVVEAVDRATRIVSVMAANNETGAVMPVSEIAGSVRGDGVLTHSDAVQSAVAMETTLESLGVDLLTLASHKLGGPKGVGILALRPGIQLEPVVHGGGQELGRRSGTHNVAGIVGMVAAMEKVWSDRKRLAEDLAEMRDRFEARLVAVFPDIEVTAVEHRLPQHSHLRIPGIDAETLLVRLDGSGVAASAGSACHSGAIEVSHVLLAMGMGEVAAECVRFTFGWTNQPADAERAAEAVIDQIRALR